MTRLVPILLLLLAACATKPDPVDPIVVPPLEKTRPTATSEDGRWTLRIERMKTHAGEDGETLLDLVATLDLGSGDRLMAVHDPVERVIVARGVDRTPPRSSFTIRPESGILSIRKLPLGASPGRLESLELRVRILDVARWETFAVRDVRVAAPLDAPPFVVRLAPQVEGVAAAVIITDASLRQASRRELVGSLGPDWVGRSLLVLDARGRRLEIVAGMAGSDDESAALYRAPMTVDRFTPERPFSVEVRLPAEYEEVEAVFRFQDLPLSR